MSERLSKKAEALRERLGLTYDHLIGFRFSVNVLIATIIVWNTLSIYDSTPIWAIASMVAAAEPRVTESRRLFRSRTVNGLVGGVVGLIFILLGGTRSWILPLALSATVLISMYIVRIKTMWRQAPITAAIIIAAGISQDSATMGILQGLLKLGEVMYGCLIGLTVSWLMSKLWIIDIPLEK